MFRATTCSSPGESIVSIRHLAYVTLCGDRRSMQAWMELHPYLHTRQSPRRVTYARCRIDTIYSPDDEHMFARNM